MSRTLESGVESDERAHAYESAIDHLWNLVTVGRMSREKYYEAVLDERAKHEVGNANAKDSKSRNTH